MANSNNRPTDGCLAKLRATSRVYAWWPAAATLAPCSGAWGVKRYSCYCEGGTRGGVAATAATCSRARFDSCGRKPLQGRLGSALSYCRPRPFPGVVITTNAKSLATACVVRGRLQDCALQPAEVLAQIQLLHQSITRCRPTQAQSRDRDLNLLASRA